MKICFCIPARYQSSRFPGKLLKKLGNLTCIERTIIQTQQSKFYTKDNPNIFLLTDNIDIYNQVNSYSINVIMTAEAYLNGTERISSNLDKIPEYFQYIVNIQADEPYINPENIDLAISKHVDVMDETNHNKLSNNRKIYYTTFYI